MVAPIIIDKPQDFVQFVVNNPVNTARLYRDFRSVQQTNVGVTQGAEIAEATGIAWPTALTLSGTYLTDTSKRLQNTGRAGDTTIYVDTAADKIRFLYHAYRESAAQGAIVYTETVGGIDSLVLADPRDPVDPFDLTPAIEVKVGSSYSKNVETPQWCELTDSQGNQKLIATFAGYPGTTLPAGYLGRSIEIYFAEPIKRVNQTLPLGTGDIYSWEIRDTPILLPRLIYEMPFEVLPLTNGVPNPLYEGPNTLYGGIYKCQILDLDGTWVAFYQCNTNASSTYGSSGYISGSGYYIAQMARAVSRNKSIHEWTRQPAVPVLLLGSQELGDPDWLLADEAHVVRDPVNAGILHMWYRGFATFTGKPSEYSICHAMSSDAGRSWAKNPNNPLYVQQQAMGRLGSVQAFIRNGKWYITCHKGNDEVQTYRNLDIIKLETSYV